MLSQIWMKVGSKPSFEELQIKFDLRYGWPTFSRVIALCSKFFSGLFSMLSHIWMKVGSKLRYEELQIMFDLRHSWPTFSWVIALQSFFSGLFLAMFLHIWMKVTRKLLYEELQIKFHFCHTWSTFYDLLPFLKLEAQGPCAGHRSIIAILYCFSFKYMKREKGRGLTQYTNLCGLNTLPH